MNPSETPTAATADAADDPRVVQALDEYVAALEAGRRIDRAAVLAAHAEIAEPLGRCLDGLDLVHEGARQLDPAGAMIGPYKLLQQIGEGGMGVVWLAEQSQPVNRRVALKIIKPGMDTRQVLARFEAERQALA